MWPCILKPVGHTRIRKTIKFTKRKLVCIHALIVYLQKKMGFIYFLSVRFTRKTNLHKAKLHKTIAKPSQKRFRCAAGTSCKKIFFFFRGTRTDVSFIYLNNSPWSKLSCKKSVIKNASTNYHKLLVTVPHKEVKRNVTTNLKNEKMNTNLKEM